MSIIKPVDSKTFKSTSWEDLNIDREGGLVILPEKFAVIKIINKKNNKVFINVTTHPAIEKPGEKDIVTEEEVMSNCRVKEEFGCQ